MRQLSLSGEAMNNKKFTIGIIAISAIFASNADAAVNKESAFKAQLLAISSAPPIVKKDFTLNPDVILVPNNLSFPDKIAKHRKNLELFKKVDATAADNFKNSNNVKVVRNATILRDSILPYAFTYQISSSRARTLKDQGFLLKNVNDKNNIKNVAASATVAGPDTTTAQACNAQGQCADIDPIVALFMIALDAITKEFKSDRPFGENNELTKVYRSLLDFAEKPAGGDNSAFVIARSVIIPQNDQGEIAKLLRDPIRRPIEIIEGALTFLNNDNGIVAQALTRPGAVIFSGWDPRPQDNGDIARAIRDPIQCTIGKLWGSCK
jgi:hypothetical protein